jgi:signal transduction histidine kinase
VKVIEDLPKSLPVLWADGRKLLQILLNLMSNAVKFTPAGGTVTVSAMADPETLTIRIADTGIGIAAPDIERALSAFGQVHNLMTREHQGTGLGLPLAKRLTELHGGRFILHSEPGVGTIIRLEFPLTGQPTAAAAE